MDRLKARIHGVGRRPVVLGILMDDSPTAVAACEVLNLGKPEINKTRLQ
jgi:hypothetical protein